jgi:hypothetical protein
MPDARDSLVAKKRKLEAELIRLITDFEKDTGLSVTKISLPRPNVAGNAKPTLERVETTIKLISG